MDFKRPAVVLVGKFGDQLLALPAMRALSSIFPSGIQLLLGEGMLSFFYRGLAVGDAARVWWNDYAKGTIDVARTVGSTAPCDLLLCFSDVRPVEELARRMGATWTVGYSEVFDRHLVFDERVHELDKLFALPQYLEPSLELAQFSEPPLFSPAAEAAAARYVSEFRGPQERLLFLHAETVPQKRWLHDGFAWVLRHFLARRPEYKVIVAGLSPCGFGVSERLILCDAHLEFTFAVMRYVDLFLGVDSCFLHAADLFRVPGVALFGPTDPMVWGFRLSPEFRHLADSSMEKIRPEPVLEALLELAG